MDAYRQSIAREQRREVVITEYRCFGPDEAFGDGIDDQALLEAISPTGLACDGGGRPGTWCDRCPWGSIDVVEDYDEDDD